MNKSGKIKNIIFDFGGVILDIDFQLTVSAFEKIGIKGVSDFYKSGHAVQLFEDLETGKIYPDEFRDKIRKFSTNEVTDIQIDDAWNKLLLGYEQQKLDLLFMIKEQYNSYLLSNTNIIHYEVYLKILQNQHQIEGFHKLFKKAYFSHEIGLRKPYRAIYEFILNEENLNPEETLFIDDTEINLRQANRLGIQTYFLDLSQNQSIFELFDEKGVLKPGKLAT